MSDENKVAGGENSQVSKPVEQETKVVSAKAYEEVSKDMHKYKSKSKETELALNEALAQLKAQEEAKLVEQNRWEEIAKNREEELLRIQNEMKEKEDRLNRSKKMYALKQELGGKIKDVYLQHADLSSISLKDDGSVDSDSLLAVANEFRQEHGQLIPSDENVNITGQAASTIDGLPQKTVKDMTHAEKVAALANIYSKQ